MSAKHLTNPVTLTLELDDIGWLRNFLKEESLHAEIDHEEVERLHTDVAIRTAKAVISKEHDRMTEIIEALDDAMVANDAREAIAKRLAATVPVMQDIATPTTKQGEGL